MENIIVILIVALAAGIKNIKEATRAAADVLPVRLMPLHANLLAKEINS